LEKAHDIDERYNKYIIQLEYCVDIDVLMDWFEWWSDWKQYINTVSLQWF
jgi:hypothetical protein